MMRLSTPARFHSLDALRGIAAWIVVIFHYRNLLTVNGRFGPDYDQGALPFHAVLRIVHERGWLAVDFFFVLSGFVFFWLYGDKVHRRAISFGAFARLRFARLYPLHLLMLLAVAAGQSVFDALAGGSEFFAYSTNTLYYFTLNLLFISAWGFGSPYSFNGPVWSISIEVFLYILFFVFCSAHRIRLAGVLLVSAIGLVASYKFGSLLGRGVFAFFLGGATYLAYARICRSSRAVLCTRAVLLACAATWLAVLATYYGPWSLRDALPERLLLVVPVAFAFPLTVLSFALLESRGRPILKRWAFLGDISYSVYLIHFPLQVAVMVGFVALGADRSIVYSGAFFGAFLLALLPLSMLSYRYVERPMQTLLRNARPRTGGVPA